MTSPRWSTAPCSPTRGLIIALALSAMLAGCDGVLPGSDTGPQGVERLQDVGYHYACGNEVLVLPDGRRFYPFVDQDGVDEDAYISAPAPRAAPARLVVATLAMPDPGIGDDTGTLTIYEDGTARFVSESGIEAWLTDEEQTYDWVC